MQLQAECLDSRVSILEVLRKALVVARKLSLSDAEVWIEKELNGYRSGDPPPDYRLLTSQIRAWNPYHGWIPIVFERSEEAVALGQCHVGQGIGELEDLLTRGEGALQFAFDPETERWLMNGLGLPLQPMRHISRSSVSGILDAVRNMVLDWSLKLEKDGILGEGLVFSAKEKATAVSANYTINYNGPVSNSQIQQNSANSVQAMNVNDTQTLTAFVDMLKTHAQELKLKKADLDQLQTEAQKMATELSAPLPDASLIRESLRTVRNVLEGCTGSIIASGLLFEIGKLLG